MKKETFIESCIKLVQETEKDSSIHRIMKQMKRDRRGKNQRNRRDSIILAQREFMKAIGQAITMAVE